VILRNTSCAIPLYWLVKKIFRSIPTMAYHMLSYPRSMGGKPRRTPHHDHAISKMVFSMAQMGRKLDQFDITGATCGCGRSVAQTTWHYFILLHHSLSVEWEVHQPEGWRFAHQWIQSMELIWTNHVKNISKLKECAVSWILRETQILVGCGKGRSIVPMFTLSKRGTNFHTNPKSQMCITHIKHPDGLPW
jgi:hypothetical protein